MDLTKVDHFRLGGYYNGDKFALFTYSGWGPCGVDTRGAKHCLPASVSNHELGKAATDCLNQSRYLPKAEFDEMQNGAYNWMIDQLLADFNVHSFTKLKKKLMFISIGGSEYPLSMSAYANQINADPDHNMTIKPSLNKNGSHWGNVPHYYESMLTFKYPCPPEELGGLIREGFRRCEGLGRDEIDFPEPLPD